MTSILSSENLVTLDVDNNVNNSGTLSSLKVIKVLPSIILKENRKRKRTPAHLSRINLNLSFRFCGSNESLNSGASSGFGSDDDCVLTPSIGVDDVPTFPSSLDDYEKRSRLSPKFLSQLSTSNSVPNIINNNAVSVDVDDCFDFAELECFGSAGSTVL